MDIMFCEGGFGLGTFYSYAFSNLTKGFIDFSISETKDAREVEIFDYFGNSVILGKKNRVLLLPLNVGIQYRLFEKYLTDNLRPYIRGGIGPSISIITPYEKEFFNAFSYSTNKAAINGYIGFGADFGLSKSNLFGINIRYYYTHFFDKGVENIYNKYRKNIASFYITLNLGIMY